jgi:hypothetical protein
VEAHHAALRGKQAHSGRDHQHKRGSSKPGATISIAPGGREKKFYDTLA